MAPIFTQARRLDGAIPPIHGLPAYWDITLARLDSWSDERSRCYREIRGGPAFDIHPGVDKGLFLDTSFPGPLANIGSSGHVHRSFDRRRRLQFCYPAEPTCLAAIQQRFSGKS